MTKIKDLPAHVRPREKLLEKGPEALSDSELFAILLRTGYKGKSALEVGRRILQSKTLKEIAGMDINKLSAIKGIGKAKAAFIVGSIELARRIVDNDSVVVVKTPRDVLNVVNYLSGKKREHLAAIYLNAKNQLINTNIISVGTLTSNMVHPREVYAPAIKNNASHIVIAHNHPSGDPEPSPEDITVTKRIVKSGVILGIPLMDHVIVSSKSHYSFKASGLI